MKWRFSFLGKSTILDGPTFSIATCAYPWLPVGTPVDLSASEDGVCYNPGTAIIPDSLMGHKGC